MTRIPGSSPTTPAGVDPTSKPKGKKKKGGGKPNPNPPMQPVQWNVNVAGRPVPKPAPRPAPRPLSPSTTNLQALVNQSGTLRAVFNRAFPQMSSDVLFGSAFQRPANPIDTAAIPSWEAGWDPEAVAPDGQVRPRYVRPVGPTPIERRLWELRQRMQRSSVGQKEDLSLLDLYKRRNPQSFI